MCCVASAPIVPLARKLDAGLGMPRGELPFISASCPRYSPPPHSPLAQHPRFFRKLSTPLLTAPLPSRTAPAFLPQGVLPLSRPLLYLGLPPRFFHTPPTPLLLSADLSPRLPAPAPRPARLHAIPSAPPSQRWDLSSDNTKKRAPFLGERCSFWVLSGRHSAKWC